MRTFGSTRDECHRDTQSPSARCRALLIRSKRRKRERRNCGPQSDANSSRRPRSPSGSSRSSAADRVEHGGAIGGRRHRYMTRAAPASCRRLAGIPARLVEEASYRSARSSTPRALVAQASRGQRAIGAVCLGEAGTSDDARFCNVREGSSPGPVLRPRTQAWVPKKSDERPGIADRTADRFATTTF